MREQRPRQRLPGPLPEPSARRPGRRPGGPLQEAWQGGRQALRFRTRSRRPEERAAREDGEDAARCSPAFAPRQQGSLLAESASPHRRIRPSSSPAWARSPAAVPWGLERAASLPGQGGHSLPTLGPERVDSRFCQAAGHRIAFIPAGGWVRRRPRPSSPWQTAASPQVLRLSPGQEQQVTPRRRRPPRPPRAERRRRGGNGP